ncbi:MAG: hypothetical protein IPM25_09510 [Chloracidobacterium sp.]|nr:hypothetical protein [Chloracidobacterium sp.]
MKTTLIFGLLLALGLSVFSSGCSKISRILKGEATLYIVAVESKEPDAASMTERAEGVLKNRFSGANIDAEIARTGENRLEVKIYGGYDREYVRAFFKTYRLEFKKAVSPPDPIPVKTYEEREEAGSAASPGQQVIPYSSEDAGTTMKYLIVEQEPIITGEDIKTAWTSSTSDSDADNRILFTLSPEGASRFAGWTRANIKNYLAIVLNDQVESVVLISSVISDQGQINGNFTRGEAAAIAMALNSGHLPAELTVVEERSLN